MSRTADPVRLAAALVVVLASTSCADDGGSAPTDPGGSTPGDSAPGAISGALDADVTVEDGGALQITWSWTSRGDEPVLVADRAPGPTGTLSPTSAYVVGLAGDDDAVQVSRRLFDRPADDDADYGAPFYLGVAGVDPGATVRGEVTVAPGLEEVKPFPGHHADGEAPVPDDPATVVFCVGVLPDDQPTDRDDDGLLTTTHDDASAQTLFCADPVDLG